MTVSLAIWGRGCSFLGGPHIAPTPAPHPWLCIRPGTCYAGKLCAQTPQYKALYCTIVQYLLLSGLSCGIGSVKCGKVIVALYVYLRNGRNQCSRSRRQEGRLRKCHCTKGFLLGQCCALCPVSYSCPDGPGCGH